MIPSEVRPINANAVLRKLVDNGWLKMNALEDSPEMIAVHSILLDAPTLELLPNQPLVLEELLEMDGEPVWWWNTSAEPVCTVCIVSRFCKEPAFLNFDFVEEDCSDITSYTYFKKRGYKAYRRKPEEAAPHDLVNSGAVYIAL